MRVPAVASFRNLFVVACVALSNTHLLKPHVADGLKLKLTAVELDLHTQEKLKRIFSSILLEEVSDEELSSLSQKGLEAVKGYCDAWMASLSDRIVTKLSGGVNVSKEMDEGAIYAKMVSRVEEELKKIKAKQITLDSEVALLLEEEERRLLENQNI